MKQLAALNATVPQLRHRGEMVSRCQPRPQRRPFRGLGSCFKTFLGRAAHKVGIILIAVSEGLIRENNKARYKSN